MKRVIRLTENDIRSIIVESLNNIMSCGAINESVYANNFDTKNKTVGLTYSRGNDSYLKGNLMAQDKVGTNKMDQNNGDCYRVTLKGGIVSYNITSIHGTKIMHYFKRLFNHQKTMVSVNTSSINGYDETPKNKPVFKVLWLDDQREPNRYLKQNSASKTSIKNREFYSKLSNKYNLNFTWVRNLNEFSEFIQKNGIPDMVSFDYDLGAGVEKGVECAKWLLSYCREQGVDIPKYYIHSANNNSYSEIPKVLGSYMYTENNSDGNANQNEEYELTMLDSELQSFMEQFKHKVEFVIRHALSENGHDLSNIVGISIYPVPSSSNFNVEMVNQLKSMTIFGLPIQGINQSLFVKDLRNLEKDSDFINKNQDYYNSNYYKTGDSKSLETYVDNSLNKYHGLASAQNLVSKTNNLLHDLLDRWKNIKVGIQQGRNIDRIVKSFVDNYKEYSDSFDSIALASEYYNTVDDRMSKIQMDYIATLKKSSKGPSIEKRSDDIWKFVKPYLRGVKNKNGVPYTRHDLAYLTNTTFEIKNISNGERMGLRNIYNPNTDVDMVQKEVNKIKNTVFVIFDDNISGGATLSDVCYQAKKIGINNIIPITFGQMSEKSTMNRIPLTPKPKEGFNF